MDHKAAKAGEEHETPQCKCPLCEEIFPQVAIGTVGAQQANGCDVDFTTWQCAGCNGKWSGDLDWAEGQSQDPQSN